MLQKSHKMSLGTLLWHSIYPNVDFLIVEGNMSLDFVTFSRWCLIPPDKAFLPARWKIDVKIISITLRIAPLSARTYMIIIQQMGKKIYCSEHALYGHEVTVVELVSKSNRTSVMGI